MIEVILKMMSKLNSSLLLCRPYPINRNAENADDTDRRGLL